MVKCCLNWKVVAGVAVTGAGLWVMAPGLVSAALPLLFLAICPVSMLLMMRMMQGEQKASAPASGMAPEHDEPTTVEIGLSTDGARRPRG